MKKGATEIDLYEIWAIIKKHAILILSACILCGLISFAVSNFILPKKYEATTKIIVVKNENESANSLTFTDLQATQKLAATYRQIILSEAISDKVIDNLNLKNQYGISTAEYNKIVSVSTENSTEVLAISVDTIDPELSAKIANEIVNVFVSNISDIYGVQNVSVLNKAKVPENFSSPNVKKNTLIGVCIGLLLSLIIIVIRTLVDSKVKTEEEIKEIFDMPIIANIPDFTKTSDFSSKTKNGKDSFDEFITRNYPNNITSEAFKSLRTNLSLRDFDEELKIINIISPTQQEGKSTCALNLGYVYSQLNKKVLIIDLDLRVPTIHEKIKTKNVLGVTDIINKECTFASAVVHYDNNLDVLFSGSKTMYASELIQSNAFKKFLNKIRDEYDIILIDCPPLNLVTDGVITSTLVDGTLLCIAENRDSKNTLIKARDTINQFEINVLGIIVTMSSLPRNIYGEYGYHYGYKKTGLISRLNKKN